MLEIIDLCHSTTSCMLSPNHCSMGWFFIGFWAILMIIAFWGYSSHPQYRLLLFKQIFAPLRFKGREGLSMFRSIYFGIGFFLGVWVLIWILIIGLTNNFSLSYLFAWIGVIGVVWPSLVAFAAWVRRCHDLGYSMLEGIFHNQIGDFFTYLRNPTAGDTLRWQIYHDKGDPSPNQFGPAPEENFPKKKPLDDDFPPVWPGNKD